MRKGDRGIQPRNWGEKKNGRARSLFVAQSKCELPLSSKT